MKKVNKGLKFKKLLMMYWYAYQYEIKRIILFIPRNIKNYILVKKYPFLRIRNMQTDKALGYEWTRYENISEGWRKAFGKQLLKDLKAELIKCNQLYDFRFSQIKEKDGILKLYCSGGSKEVLDLLDYYELLSFCYCRYCGKPARYVTKGFITYLCEDCYFKRGYKYPKQDRLKKAIFLNW